MKPFSGTKGCVKCGTTAPYSQYEPQTSTRLHGKEQTIFPEHLKRTCRHCAYTWEENVKEAE